MVDPIDGKGLHSGFLFKKGGGRGLLGRRNWKLRWFMLSFDGKLNYYARGTGADDGTGKEGDGDALLKGSVNLGDGYRVVDLPDTDKRKRRFKVRH